MALNEVRILASITHENIIAFKDAFFDLSTLCIIMEFADGGDLMNKVEST
jgi:NIMA (never in mitosis gene a)-related kinase